MSLRRIVIGAALGGGLAACAPPRMQVPPEIASRTEVLEAGKRGNWPFDEGFTLGPYSVRSVDRKRNSSLGFQIAIFSKDSTVGGYSFAFEGPGAGLGGRCANGKEEKFTEVYKGFGSGSTTTRLGCECGTPGRGAIMDLYAGGGPFGGTLTTSAGRYEVVVVGDKGAPGWMVRGYRAEGPGGVAAVEVVRPGRIWLDRKHAEPERAEIACLFVGLLLYQEPSDAPK